MNQREGVLATSSVVATAAGFPLEYVNAWLQCISLCVGIVSGVCYLYLMWKRRHG
jgi:uncharacterized membrane protein